jgi:uncharacterized protein YeaO (DUF488 family)
MINLKRAYDAPAKEDGHRMLVERLWPRGVKKEDAKIDEWLKEIAPSAELRKWYGHDVKKWPEFKRRYVAELRKAASTIEKVRHRARGETVTFVYAARDEEHNSALVLRDFIYGGREK